MDKHAVRRFLSLMICIFAIVCLFSVCASAEDELETLEIEIPNPPPEFPTLWLRALTPDDTPVDGLLLELVLSSGDVAAELLTDEYGYASCDLESTEYETSATLRRSAYDSSDYGPASSVDVALDCGSLVSVGDQSDAGFYEDYPYVVTVYPDRYNVFVDGDIPNGTVTVSSSAPAVRETVTVTASPADYYELESLRVLRDQTELELTTEGDTASFVMPAGDVTVFASFKPIVYAVSIGETEHGTVLADKSSATAGETVTLTITPESEYLTESLSVTDADGEDVEVSADGTFLMPGGDVTISAVFREGKPTFTTHSLVLGGELGLNFFMDLPMSEGVDYSGSRMSFTVSGETEEDFLDPSDTDLNGNGYYGFTCLLNALQLADDISAEFHYTVNGEEKTVSQVYTAEAYLNALIDNDFVSDEVKTLAGSLLDYGYHSQLFLSGLENRVGAGDHAGVTTHFTDTYSADQIADILNALAGQDFGRQRNRNIATVTCSLYLDSTTSICLYLTPANGYDGAISALLDNEPVSVAADANGRYRIVIPDISADQLDRVHRVVISTDGADPMLVQVSVLSYIKTCLEHEASSDEMIDAMASLYYYYAAYTGLARG